MANFIGRGRDAVDANFMAEENERQTASEKTPEELVNAIELLRQVDQDAGVYVLPKEEGYRPYLEAAEIFLNAWKEGDETTTENKDLRKIAEEITGAQSAMIIQKTK